MCNKTKNAFTYYSIVVIVFIPFVFYLCNFSTFMSSPLSITITSLIVTICLIVNSKQIFTKNDLIIYIINAIFLFINISIYEDLGAPLIFYNTISLLLILNNISFSKKQIQRFRLFLTLSLFLLLISMNVSPYYNTIYVTDAKGTVINLNTFGLLYLILFFYAFNWISNTNTDKYIQLLFKVIIAIFCIYRVHISDCRSALIAMCIFLIINVLHLVKSDNYKKVLSITVLFVLIFPVVYLHIVDIVGTISFLGKSFSTRYTVWKSVFEFIKRHPFIGSGAAEDILMSKTEYTSSAHNSLLGIWKTNGIISLISLMFYLTYGKNNIKISKENLMSRQMFLGCLIVCSLETFINDANTYLFCLTLLLNCKEEKNDT